MSGLRAASQQDVPEIVAVHLRAFPGFFLTRLGPRFLAELYQGFIQDPSGIIFVACDNDAVVGFVAGTDSPEGFFGRLLRRRGARFLLAAASAFVSAPLLVGHRLARAVVYRGERPSSVQRAALLSSVGVNPQASGTGIGRRLVDAFCDEALRRGVQHVYLTTDRDQNVLANRFYANCGFTLESSFRRPGNRWMNRYVRTLVTQDT
jgi:ribosomal protein S18 acetylase RimI-like enzyme